MPGDDLQLSFGGLTVGKGTPYRVRNITGLRDFSVRSTDDSSASRWGSFAGPDQVESSSITIEFIVAYDQGTIRNLETAFAPADQSSPSALLPLSWKWPDDVEVYRLARCRRRTRAMTPQSERANGAVSMLVELQAPDPRMYAAAPHLETLLPFGEGTLGFNFTVGSGADIGMNWPTGTGTNIGANYAGERGSGTVFAPNDGNATTFPTVTFIGPPDGMNRWRLRNLWTGESADFAWPLGAGEQMVVDFAVKATPKTGDAVTVDGAARYSAWQHPRVPLRLPAGVSELRFDVLEGSETGALAQIEWNDAWI